MQSLTFGNENMIQDAKARGQQRSSKVVVLVMLLLIPVLATDLSIKPNILSFCADGRLSVQAIVCL